MVGSCQRTSCFYPQTEAKLRMQYTMENHEFSGMNFFCISNPMIPARHYALGH